MSRQPTHRIAVTGIGAVGALGLGREALWVGLAAGTSGLGPVSSFEPPPGSARMVGEVRGFSVQNLLGGKGFRHLSRSAQLLLAAVHLAFRDRGGEPPGQPDPGFGLVVGTALGTAEVISRFDREALTDGPQYVNPMDFPGTVWNSPAGEAAIRFRLAGLNATLANGFTAGHDALAYAAEALRAGRARAVLAGGVDALSPELLLGLSCSGPLCDRLTPGEGACLLVLERLEDSRAAGRCILGELSGWGSGFDPRDSRGARGALGWASALRQALGEAGTCPADVDLVSLRRSGLGEPDRREEAALAEVFPAGQPAKRQAVAEALGETFGAAGAFQAAAALGALGPGRSAVISGGSCLGRSSALVVRGGEA